MTDTVENGLPTASYVVLLSSYFFFSVAYAIIIPASLDIFEQFSGAFAGTWSGLMIGMFFVSSIVGMTAFRFLKTSGFTYKTLFVYPFLGRLAASALCAATLAGQGPAGDNSVIFILLFCRFIEGAINSCQQLCAVEILMYTSRDRVQLSALIALFANVGIGCGMLLAAGIDSGLLTGLYTGLGIPMAWQQAPGAMVMFWMCLFWAVAFVMGLAVVTPKDPAEQSELDPLTEALVREGNSKPNVRRLLICAGILFGTCRGFVNSGIDCVSVLILQEQWRWTRTKAAVAVGLCYISSITWHAVFQFLRLRVKLSDSTLVHGGIAMCSIAAVGLFNMTEDEHSNIALLLAADTVIFPVFMLTAMVVFAFMTRASLQNSAAFQLQGVLVLNKLFTETIGLGLGPVASRSIVTDASHHIITGVSRNIYAGFQLALIIIAALAWGLAVNPCYKVLAADARGPSWDRQSSPDLTPH